MQYKDVNYAAAINTLVLCSSLEINIFIPENDDFLGICLAVLFMKRSIHWFPIKEENLKHSMFILIVFIKRSYVNFNLGQTIKIVHKA